MKLEFFRAIKPVRGFGTAACLLLYFAAGASAQQQAATRPRSKPVLSVTPKEIVLTSPREVRHVLITETNPDATTRDVTSQATLVATSDVVRIGEHGAIIPVKDGVGTIEVTSGNLTTRFSVVVRGMQENPPVGFVKDVAPVLSKAGCNNGVCHGGAKGKNGFKLSLRGYDAHFDYEALINDLAGRRFNRADPEQSLFLLKPTMAVAHGGGLRFPAGSRYHELLLQWLREGVRFDDAKTGTVSRIKVFPAEIFMSSPGGSQQMLVVAQYPDGSERDVTDEANYVSGTPAVAEVSPTGLVHNLLKGEATIQVRYQGQAVTVAHTAVTDREGFRWTSLPQHNYIDGIVDAKLKRLKVLPSDVCTDSEFIRRVSLDLTGLIPKPDLIRAFLENPAPSRVKRGQLIDKLLQSPEYVDHWTMKWGDLLFCNRRFLGEKGLWSYRNWIHRSIAENKPYDRFVREILTARGSTYENPPANFFRATRDPKVMMESVSQVFLGVRIMCANCHDHPFESWTQRNYYEMTSFFSAIGIKEGQQSDEEIIYQKREETEVRHPKYGYLVSARFPFAAPAHLDAENNLREQFASWLTSAENPYFGEAIANRLWSYFFSRGIFDPVDDLRPSNPPSNPALLEALAEDLKRSQFDLKHLMRSITNSRAYQSSYKTNAWNEVDIANFSHQIPRRLGAEQLFDAVTRATGSRIQFEGVPEGLQAQQLPDTRVGIGGFLDLFGRPLRETACECERRSDINLAQALNLVNGGVLADAIADSEGRVAKLILAGANDRKIAEELYLSGLSRNPGAEELKNAVSFLQGGNNRAERAQDLLWALLNSHAFLFNR